MKIKNFDISMLLLSAVPGSILMTAWMMIFLNNSGSFTLSTADASLLALSAWAAVSLLIFAVLYAVSFFSLHKWITAALLGLSCSMIIQYHWAADFFGSDFYFQETTPEFLLLLCCHILFLALPAAAALWQKERCCKWRIRISLILIFMQIVTLIHCVCTVKKHSSSYDFKEYSFSEKEKFTFGKKENIIILIVDCMGERLLKEVLVRYPELQTSFKDFTCFDQMRSPLPRTMYAVPALLTGINFPGAETGEPENDDHGIFLSRVCRESSSLLQLARKKGFRVEGYPFILQTISYAPDVIDNSESISHDIQKDSAFKIFEIIQARLIPGFLKPLVFSEAENEMIPFVQQGVAVGKEDLSYDQNFYRRLKQEFCIGSREKVFKYLHIHGAHDPVTTDEELATKENALKYQQLRGSLKIVELLLQKLREHGIYDSSTIVITGDHSERYTPEIAAFIKRPFEKKNALVFNSVKCQISQISGSVAKIADLDPKSPSLFDLAFVPGSVKEIWDQVRQFAEFSDWKKLEKWKKIIPDGPIQGSCMLRGKQFVIVLTGDNTLRTADKITITAKNLSTAEQYEAVSIKGKAFRDILVPEMTFPDGDYLLSITETGIMNGVESSSISRIVPSWLRVRGKELSVLSQAPELFHESVFLDKEMTFYPLLRWPGVRFSRGCEFKWGRVIIPPKGSIRLRLPESSGACRVEICCSKPVLEKGDIWITVNGRVIKKAAMPGLGQHVFSVDAVPGKDGVAEISLEFRNEKKKRGRKNFHYSDLCRIHSITVKKSGTRTPHSR